jgi:hypothetical protein
LLELLPQAYFTSSVHHDGAGFTFSYTDSALFTFFKINDVDLFLLASDCTVGTGFFATSATVALFRNNAILDQRFTNPGRTPFLVDVSHVFFMEISER